MKTSRFVIGLVLLSAVLFGASPLQAGDPAGHWSGTWVSLTNGHKGKICARVHQLDCCTYKVTFCGTFLGVVPFAYAVPMTAVQGPNGERQLYGEANLPLFGKFHCRANVTPCCFIASYWSVQDQGQFSMRRN